MLGTMRRASSRLTVRRASVSLRKTARQVQRLAGLGTSLSVARVITPSMPSEPIQRSRRFKPEANFFSGAPQRTGSPVGKKPSRPRT